MVAKVEAAGSLLHIFPIHTQVQLRAQWDFGEILERLRECFSRFRAWTDFIAQVGDESGAKVRDYIVRRGKRHHHVPTRIFVRCEGSLIEAVEKRRTGAEAVLVEILRWGVSPASGAGRTEQRCRP